MRNKAGYTKMCETIENALSKGEYTRVIQLVKSSLARPNWHSNVEAKERFKNYESIARHGIRNAQNNRPKKMEPWKLYAEGAQEKQIKGASTTAVRESIIADLELALRHAEAANVVEQVRDELKAKLNVYQVLPDKDAKFSVRVRGWRDGPIPVLAKFSEREFSPPESATVKLGTPPYYRDIEGGQRDEQEGIVESDLADKWMITKDFAFRLTQGSAHHAINDQALMFCVTDQRGLRESERSDHYFAQKFSYDAKSLLLSEFYPKDLARCLGRIIVSHLQQHPECFADSRIQDKLNAKPCTVECFYGHVQYSDDLKIKYGEEWPKGQNEPRSMKENLEIMYCKETCFSDESEYRFIFHVNYPLADDVKKKGIIAKVDASFQQLFAPPLAIP